MVKSAVLDRYICYGCVTQTYRLTVYVCFHYYGEELSRVNHYILCLRSYFDEETNFWLKFFIHSIFANMGKKCWQKKIHCHACVIVYYTILTNTTVALETGISSNIYLKYNA